MNTTTWYIIGTSGALLQASRFLIQWIKSEIQQKSSIGKEFWILSIIGGILLLAYSIFRKDPIFIVGQTLGIIMYTRNYILLKKRPKMKKVQQFYNTTPFPDYELQRFNTTQDLINHAYPMAHIINKNITHTKTIIDIGCGTGQLAAYLSLQHKVTAIDFSTKSLEKATQLKNKLHLHNLTIHNLDIEQKKHLETIPKHDYLLCLGVLHHTTHAYTTFKNILPLLKPQGYIAIGLYNKYARIPLQIRKLLVNTIYRDNTYIHEKILEQQITDTKDRERVRGWFNDQYKHPHETTHTIKEIKKWFKKHNIEYLHTLPNTNNIDPEISGLWYKQPPTTTIQDLETQRKWITQISHEGGYWITFGQKK